MIQRAKHPPRVFSFVCDGCSSEFLETDEYYFDRAQSKFRDEKWVNMSPPGQKMQQFCPDCAKRIGID